MFDIGLRVEARRGRLKRRGIKNGRNGDGFDGNTSHEPLLKRDDVLISVDDELKFCFRDFLRRRFDNVDSAQEEMAIDLLQLTWRLLWQSDAFVLSFEIYEDRAKKCGDEARERERAREIEERVETRSGPPASARWSVDVLSLRAGSPKRQF